MRSASIRSFWLPGATCHDLTRGRGTRLKPLKYLPNMGIMTVFGPSYAIIHVNTTFSDFVPSTHRGVPVIG
eukprot:1209767-Prymnesium_polylepis.2